MPTESSDYEKENHAMLVRLEGIERRLASLEGRVEKTASAALYDTGPQGNTAPQQAWTPPPPQRQGLGCGIRAVVFLAALVILSLLTEERLIRPVIWVAGMVMNIVFLAGGFNFLFRKKDVAPVTQAVSGAAVLDGPVATTPAPGAGRATGTGELKASVLIGRIGAVIILFGFITLFAIMVQAGIIGPLARLAIAFIVSAAALWAGDFFSAKYTSWSRSLTGLGLVLLYFALYMFTRPGYAFLPREIVFVGMILATALSGYLALRYKSVIVATFGIVGGYLTPILLSTGDAHPWFLLFYVMLLNSAVLWIGARQTWRELNAMSFVASFIYLPTIAGRLDPWPAALAIALIFAFYNILPVIGSIVRKVRTTGADIFLIALNGAAAFFVCLDRYDTILTNTSLGFLAALVAVIYVVQGIVAMRRSPTDYALRATYGLIGMVFLVAAVPLLAGDAHRVTVVIWTLMSLVLLWAGFQLAERGLRVLAMVLLGLSMLGVIVTMEVDRLTDFTPIFNTRALTYGIFIAAVYVAGLFYSAGKYWKMDVPPQFSWILPAIANGFTLMLLTLEVSDVFRQQMVTASGGHDQYRMLRDSQNVAISGSFALYGIGLIAVGISYRLRWVRVMALGLLGIVVLKVLFVDTSNLDQFARLILFMIVGILLMAASYSFQRFKRFIIDEKPASPPPPASDAPLP